MTGDAGWLKAVLNLVDGIVVEIDREGQIVEINQTGCSLLGYTREQLLGASWFDRLVPAALRGELKQTFAKLLEDGSSTSEYHETPILLCSGEERIFRWHSTLLRDADGMVSANLSVGVDVTSLRRSQYALLQSESRFRAFMDHSPLLAYIKDQTSVVHYGNPAWAKALGKPLHELLGRPEAEIYPADVLAAFQQAERDVWEAGQTVDLTSHGYAQQRWWRVIKFPIFGDAGERLVGGFAWDVTESVESQQALAASEAHAKAVLDTAVDAIINIDLEGVIQTFNAAASRMFGYRAEEVIGKKINMLMPQPYRGEHDDYMGRYLATGERRIIGIGREVRAERKDGSIFPINLAVSEVRVGELRSFTGIIRDLSEEKRRERELKDKEEEARLSRERLTHMTRISTLGELAAGIAHEINQPLTAISNYAQACKRLLKAGKLSEPEAAETLEKISNQALRAGEVIRKMRNLSRQTLHERSAEDINEVIRDCVALADYEGRLLDIGLRLQLTAELPRVHIDRVQIQQVILNLLRNAQEAMEISANGEPILLSTSSLNDDAVAVAVKDGGKGIDPADERNLFQHFFTTKASGTGMGLAVSRSIIEAHGGNLWFIRNPEGGVTFCFSLPRALDEDL